jgi:hypothetical protein
MGIGRRYILIGRCQSKLTLLTPAEWIIPKGLRAVNRHGNP